MLTVFLPESYIETLDMFVVDERFPNRSEAIRTAIRDLIRNEIMMKKMLEKNQFKEENVNIGA